MAVTPLGNSNFINQNAPVVSQVHANQQARFDMQSLMAAELASQQSEEIKEVRPMEESYKIDPEKEHERQKNEEEASEFESEKQNSRDSDGENLDDIADNEEIEPSEHHMLDITIWCLNTPAPQTPYLKSVIPSPIPNLLQIFNAVNDKEKLFKIHSDSPKACPLGGKIEGLLTGHFLKAQEVLENSLRSITLQDLLDELINL